MSNNEFILVQAYKEEFRDMFDNEEHLEKFLLESIFITSFRKLDDGLISVAIDIDSPYAEYLMKKSNDIMEEQMKMEDII